MFMFAAVAVSLAATISPVTVEVITRGGHREALHVADADATVLRVCAHEDGVADVCSPVVVDATGAHATLDVDHRVVRFSLVRTTFDARSATPAAIAVGCGALTAASTLAAVTATSLALSAPTASDVVSAASDVDTVPATLTAEAFTPIAAGLWLVAGASAVGTVVASVVAVSAATHASAE
jgi:hypothetical protein